MFQLPVVNNSTCQQAFCTRQVWEKVHVGPRVMRRGHNSGEAEVVRFPRDPPPHATNRPNQQGEPALTGTVWVSIVTRCTLVTLASSVVGQTDALAVGTADTGGHTSAVTHAACRVGDSRGRRSSSRTYGPRLHLHITPSLRLTLAVWEVVESWLAALAALPVHTLAAQAAPRSITHLPHRPSGVAHTL